VHLVVAGLERLDEGEALRTNQATRAAGEGGPLVLALGEEEVDRNIGRLAAQSVLLPIGLA